MRQVDDVVELIWESLAGDGGAEVADTGAARAADQLPVWLAAGSVSRHPHDPRTRSRPAPHGNGPAPDR